MSGLNLSGKPVYVADLVKDAAEALSDGKVSYPEIIRLGGLLAQKVNRLAQLSGPEKKELVIEVIDLALQELVKKNGENPAVSAAAQFAKDALPAVLDFGVDVARGRVDLKKPSGLVSCLTALLSCVSTVAIAVPPAPAPAPASEAAPNKPVEVQEAPQQQEDVSAAAPEAPAPAPAALQAEENVTIVEAPLPATEEAVETQQESLPSKETESSPAEAA